MTGAPATARRWPRRLTVAVGAVAGAVVVQAGVRANALPAGTTGLAACGYWAPPMLFGAGLGSLATTLVWPKRRSNLPPGDGIE
jgi:hypothetical protein